MFGIAAAVAGNELQLGYGYKEFGIVCIIQPQEFFLAICGIDNLQARIAPDTVRDMNDRIADFEFREIANHHVDVCRMRGAAQRALRGTCVKFGFSENRDGLNRQALKEGAD